MSSHPAGSTGPADWQRLGNGLSCYTANLAGYLAIELPGVRRWLAESVRLAVRVDLPGGELAFSHHAYPLDRLPDGTSLRYASVRAADHAATELAATELAAAELAAEVGRHGRVLVVVDNARLPWSPALGTGQAAPHWLLVSGRDGPDWQVCDAFSGLLPAGEQQPHAGRLSTEALLGAMQPPPRWTRQQRRRNALAFGFPVPVPPGATRQWLRRSPAGAPAGPADPAHAGTAHGGGRPAAPAPAELPGTWLTSDNDVLRFLAAQVAAQGEHAARYLDDLWSAAAHRVFRYRWLAGRPGVPDAERERFAAAGAAWARLPVALRFAVDSARRGQPRPSLIATTFEHLRGIEARAAAAAMA